MTRPSSQSSPPSPSSPSSKSSRRARAIKTPRAPSGDPVAALRGRLLAAFRRPGGFRRLAAGVVCTGLHQAFVLMLLLAGAFADDPATLMVVGFVAGVVLLLNVLLHKCPLSVMEEEKWGCSVPSAGSAPAKG